MSLVLIGLNHRSAPIEVRERVAIGETRLGDALRSLREQPEVRESAIISTCNRVELLAVSSDAGAPLDWLLHYQGQTDGNLHRHFYQFEADRAVGHLLRVACGLDSMVVGEPQVLGQIKQAYRTAKDADALGPLTERLFQQAFTTGKRVRTETDIGRNPVSIPSVTMSLARKIFGRFQDCSILFVGAGKMIESCIAHIGDHNPRALMVANRSPARAQRLAQGIDASAHGLDDLPALLSKADIVISSTGSESHIINLPMLRQALGKRRGNPLFVVDLAVPRDVEPAAAQLNDVYLYTVDDLQKVAQDNINERQKAAAGAQRLVEEEVESFMRWWRGTQANAAITDLRDRAHRDGQVLAERALKRIEAGHPPDEVLSELVRRLTNQLLHGPSRRVRAAAEADDLELIRAAARLLGNDPT